MEKLKFIETLSVQEFKARHDVEKIEIKQNPRTGKFFFVFGISTGSVSERFNRGELSEPVISKVASPEEGEIFFMLHQRGEGGAPVVAVL